MRYIYLDASKIDEDWLKKATDLTAKINAEEDPEKRRKLIKKNAALWGKPAIKSALLDMSFKKCWYTEADDCVSDWHVDHFRPKADYHWLAFEWTNYRISGGIPNRKKSDNFPQIGDAKCATFEAQDLAHESPKILDPANPDDPALVTYDEQGTVKSARPNDTETNDRVDVTCEFLDLNSERLIGKRQEIWNACQTKADQIRKLVAGNANIAAALTSDHVKELASELKKATKPQAPFSSVAKAFVRIAGCEWVYDIPDVAA